MTIYEIANDEMQISVKSQGAELYSVKSHNIELLWQADPQFWPRHAPNLFPIVGRLKNDQLIHQGKPYPMTQHGFARDMEFECIEQENSLLMFRLTDNEQTRCQYPFLFELLVSYALLGSRLMIVYTVRNYHEQELPFSIGGHPGFNWPLLPDTISSDYHIRFEHEEAAHIWQLKNGLISQELRNSPLEGKSLMLSAELFENDALIFPDLNSQSVSYQTKDGKGITFDFTGFPDLGIWTKPGAPFICIEPWSGHASPESFAGEFTEKPGVHVLPPFSEHSLSYSVNIHI
ncbi:MAG: aldose 1-epimerase family protein [Gammaproteobacteria bacterium]|nr:aldose 1-epimerase family protein [Gammaproteobacteria bacterium]